MLYSSASAVLAVHAAISTFILCLPLYHCHLARRPFLLDLAFAPASVILRLYVCTILYKSAEALNHWETAASEKFMYSLEGMFCTGRCDPGAL